MEEIPTGLSAFLAALEARNGARAAARLAEYVILESPIDVEPVVGRQHVAAAVSRILDVVDEIIVAHVIAGDGCFAVATTLTIGNTELDGMDLIGINAEGKVASLVMHLRPLRAVVTLQNRLAAAGGTPLLVLTEER